MRTRKRREILRREIGRMIHGRRKMRGMAANTVDQLAKQPIGTTHRIESAENSTRFSVVMDVMHAAGVQEDEFLELVKFNRRMMDD